MKKSTSRQSVVVTVAHRDLYVAAGIAALLRAQPDLAQLPAGALNRQPDVLVTDYDSALRQGSPAKAPATMVVTDQCAGWQVRRAVEAGVRGYLLQDCSAAELVDAVRCIATGHRFLSPVVAEQLLDALNYEVPTVRQLQVLQLISQGLSNKAISSRLGIGERTVKMHVKAVLSRLGARTRTAAMAEAMRRGMLDGAGRAASTLAAA